MSDYDEYEFRRLWDDNSCWNEGNESWKLKDSKRIRAELQDGADPDEGFALHEAVKERLTQTVYALVKGGADLNLRNDRDQLPLEMVDESLSWATTKKVQEAVNIAKYLVKNGADLNAKDEQGNTALHHAHNLTLIDLYIEKGADPVALNESGKTPYDHQKEKIEWRNPGNTELVGMISPALKASHEKYHIQKEIASLSNAWKPSDCKEAANQSTNVEQPERQTRKRLM